MARTYQWNGKAPAKPVSGQKQIILHALSARKDEAHTGRDWAALIGPDLKTRQDPYRVVLYYLLILNKDGVLTVQDGAPNAIVKGTELETKPPTEANDEPDAESDNAEDDEDGDEDGDDEEDAEDEEEELAHA